LVSDGSLAGRRLIVTGAAGGIGSATARACAAAGARLLLVDTAPAVEAVAEELGAVAVVDDVARDGAADEALAVAQERFGGIDGLANIAGLQRPGDLLTAPNANWDLMLAVNLRAPATWSRVFIPAMLEAGGGAIVNMGSVVGVAAPTNSVGYSVSKAALLALTRSIAVDYGRQGVRCNAVSPGIVNTELLRPHIEADPARLDALAARVPLDRIAEPHEVASCCVYLLSDASSFVNGANFMVDGGHTVAL
jgi:NAD(P)-dependent dehydrogenase (short-subunit alcohol dehydrogenase family)